MSTALAEKITDQLPAVADPMVSMIERVATNPKVPLERLERMLSMKERMEDRAREDADRQARREYFSAMAKCQAELPVVTKNRANTHTKSRYADLAAIEEQAMPIIHRYGFGVMFQPAGYNDKGELQIKWKITHEGGHSESDVAGVPVDNAGSQGKVNKTGTQAFGSTMTYGRRYLLCNLFNISTGDDNDGSAVAVGETVSEEDILDLQALIDEVRADLPKFLQVMGVEYLDDLPKARLKEAVATLETKRAARK